MTTPRSFSISLFMAISLRLTLAMVLATIFIVGAATGSLIDLADPVRLVGNGTWWG